MKKIYNILPFLFSMLAITACHKDKGETIQMTQSDPVITVLSIDPTSGYVGETLTLTGENFGVVASHAHVYIGTVEAPIYSIQDDQIVVTVPEGASAGYIKVQVLSAETVTELMYDVLGTPGVTSINPAYGFVDDEITFVGHDFGTATDRVYLYFNGTTEPAEVVSCTNEQFVVVVPEGAQSGAMTLRLSEQSVPSLPSEFTVVERATLTSVSPASAYCLSEVTLTGTNFGTDKNAVTVYFGDGIASPEIVSCTNTEIVAKVPTMNLGETQVYVATAYEQIETYLDFTVVASPTVSGVSDTDAYIGQKITLTGTNFGTDAGLVEVKLGETAATVNSCSNTEIVFTVPTMTAGNTTLTLEIIGLAIDLGDNASFTVKETPVVTAVKTSNVLSNNDMGLTNVDGLPIVPFASGNALTFTGENYGTSTGSFQVRFGDTELVTPTSISEGTSMVTAIPDAFTGGTVSLVFDGVEFDVAELEQVKAGSDITKFVLKNYGTYTDESGTEISGFYKNEADGTFVDGSNTWCTPGDWTVTDAAKNCYDADDSSSAKVGGLRYNSSSEPNGMLIMQRGWGITGELTNGKIYQDAYLPKGDYTVKVTVEEVSGSPELYFAANSGENSLPDIGSIAQAASYLQFTALASANGPETKTLSVSVSSENAKYSIGFVGSCRNNSCGRFSSISITLNTLSE